MARQKRFDVAGVTQHVIQRGNNRSRIFGCDDDKKYFRSLLVEATQEHGVAVHAYVFMTNHVHLLATPTGSGCVGKTMQSLGRRYVQYFNRRYGRSGTLWEGRYRSAAIDAERYLLICYRYIELNPVRAGMVDSPGAFRWSSYARNAYGRHDQLVASHQLYHRLGRTTHERESSYRQLFDSELDGATVEAMRERTNTGWALGGKAFRTAIEALVDRPAAPKRRGGDRRSSQCKAGRTNRV